jgi:hypothetical protein
MIQNAVDENPAKTISGGATANNIAARKNTNAAIGSATSPVANKAIATNATALVSAVPAGSHDGGASTMTTASKLTAATTKRWVLSSNGMAWAPVVSIGEIIRHPSQSEHITRGGCDESATLAPR